MRRAAGIVSLTGIVVAIALATSFDSPFGLAQGRLAAQARQGGAGRATAKPYTTWRSYAGGAHSSQYSALEQINKSNVASSRSPGVSRSPATASSIPVVVDGVMYLPVGGGALAAIDAATGKEIWRKDSVGAMGARGMNYWESRRSIGPPVHVPAAGRRHRRERAERRADHLVRHQRQGRSARRDGAAAGGRVGRPATPVASSRTSTSSRCPAAPATRPAGRRPCLRRAHRQARLDLPCHSARRRVRLRHVAGRTRARSAAAGTTGASSRSTRRTASPSSASAARASISTAAIARATTCSPTRWWPSTRAPASASGTSRLIHHDLWDYDIPQSAKLLTITQNGKPRQIVAQATKQGFLFVFDRLTGQPIWPIEERKVPQTDVPGEWTSPTQPFPTKPEPFAKQSFTEKDINPYLPKETQDELREQLRSYRNEGLYHAAELRGLDLDAGPQRRRELRHVGRGSDRAASSTSCTSRCRRSTASRCRTRPVAARTGRRPVAAAVAEAVAVAVAAGVAVAASSRPSRRRS